MFFERAKILLFSALIIGSAAPHCNLVASELVPESRSESVQYGDSIQKILERHKFSSKDIECLRKAGHFTSLPEIMADEKYLVTRQLSSNKSQVRFYEENGNWATTYWKNPGGCGKDRNAIQWEIKIIKKSGKIVGSIFNTFEDVFGDHRMITKFMDAFRFCCDLTRGLQRGDEFSVEFERLFDHGVFIRYGAVRKAKLTYQGQNFEREFVRFPGGGTYLAEDLVREEAPFYLPVAYFHVSSLFQRRRFHPVKKRTIAHQGIDFPLETGAPVFAAKNGKVKKIGKNRASGNYVVIQHSGGFESKYLHLSEVDKSLKEFKRINAGDKVGEIGCTGYCTKPHLHFAVKKNRSYVDPLPLLRPYPALFEEEFLKRLK